MSSSTFETLPDEILMIILRYSDNIYTIFRTFSGLNQRLNNILVDRRLHLFTDFLFISVGDANFNNYYNSKLFQDVSRQLSYLKTTENDKLLRQCLQSLVAFHIKEKSKELEQEFQSRIRQFQSIRTHLNHDEIVTLDNELKETFLYLRHRPYPIKYIRKIEFLILSKGARLRFNDDEFVEFNFIRAVNELLLVNIRNVESVTRQYLNPLIQMFKALIISNPNLLHNKDHPGDSSSCVHYFLIYSIYRLQYFYPYKAFASISMQGYQSAVDLLLFTTTCLKHVFNDESWVLDSFSHILITIANSTELDIDHEIFIQTSQMEILKIILDEYSQKETAPWNEHFNDSFRLILHNLTKNNRLDVILAMYHHNELIRNFFQKPTNSRKNLNIMTENRTGRQLFRELFNENPLGPWFTSKDLLFDLLQKRECKSMKKLLKLFPSLVHQCDDDGNNPLLFVCLNVRGCRHRLVKLLIDMGSDLQIRNLEGKNFIDALQLEKNRTLLERLIERDAIHIDHVSGEITVTLAN